MPVGRLKDGETEDGGKQADDGARDGDGDVEPADAFEPVCFHAGYFVLQSEFRQTRILGEEGVND